MVSGHYVIMLNGTVNAGISLRSYKHESTCRKGRDRPPELIRDSRCGWEIRRTFRQGESSLGERMEPVHSLVGIITGETPRTS